MEIDMAAPMTRRLMVLAAAAAVLGACATRPPPILAPAASPLAELEPLYAVQAGRRDVTIRVVSFGCTAKADFAFFVERQGQATTLAFGRRRVDPCRAAAHHVDLTFTYEELGLSAREPVFMLNPLIADRGL
jgi:hypothetical protein